MNICKLFSFAECITSKDCPAGGTNYVCNANECDCPSPKVLDGDKCVGMLPFEKEKYQGVNCNSRFSTAQNISAILSTFEN